MSDLTYTTELVVVTCWCGMPHAVPRQLRNHQIAKHNDGRDFAVYCPLGHAYIVSGKGKAALEAERAERLARQLANRDEDVRAARAALTATKGQLTKARKRAVNGVCPCCNRSFVNVARHVATQHPGAVPS